MKSRFTEEQIISILGEAQAGAKVAELCRRHGLSDATFVTHFEPIPNHFKSSASKRSGCSY